jgi:hypothetical protein
MVLSVLCEPGTTQGLILVSPGEGELGVKDGVANIRIYFIFFYESFCHLLATGIIPLAFFPHYFSHCLSGFPDMALFAFQ